MSHWIDVEPAPRPGEIAPVDEGVFVANVAGAFLAYRDACVGCGASLLDGVLDDGALECPYCHRCFSLGMAGHVLGIEGLQLAPVPLRTESGRVRVLA